MTVALPWPPAVLRGHAKGHWRPRATATKACREHAHYATMASKLSAPAEGDVHLTITLTPPNNRGDRQNSETACKAYLDGIADGLKVNDRRFLVRWVHTPAVKPGRITVEVSAQ